MLWVVCRARVRGKAAYADNTVLATDDKTNGGGMRKILRRRGLINDRQRCVPVSLSIVRKCLFCDRVAAMVYIICTVGTRAYTHTHVTRKKIEFRPATGVTLHLKGGGVTLPQCDM